MPDQHCPTCGAARSPGCGCLVPDGSLDETAVLPHLEGPPLVRPYVPQAVGQVADGPPVGVAVRAHVEPHPGPRHDPHPGPADDPFGTTVLPPGAPPAVPPLGPDADAYATTVLPPVSSAPPFQPPQPPAPTGNAPEDGPVEGPEDELGVFPFAHAAPAAAPGSGRAARRAAEQPDTGGPLARRKGLLIAAGAGLLALTVGLAYALTPSAGSDDRAVPAPTATLGLTPVDPTVPAPPSPSAPPPASDTPSATPTPTRTSAKPSPARTTAASPPPAAPATTVAAAPPAPVPIPVPDPATTPPPSAPTPTPPAPTTPPAPSATPTPTPTVRVLEYGMEGPDVQALQRKLSVVICWEKVPPTGRYDDRTRLIVTYFQDIYSVRGDARGVYGPITRAALEPRNSC
ncbi:peptidoglycan-binding protein [Kitasatospora sp. NPDC057692]|uniref:peptidoglycan-binding domain-containing protein n=1 Tax=Kitasatospora sp. NPDC057692 TaxID=3346215 RepID=UPI0036857045